MYRPEKQPGEEGKTKLEDGISYGKPFHQAQWAIFNGIRTQARSLRLARAQGAIDNQQRHFSTNFVHYNNIIPFSRVLEQGQVEMGNSQTVRQPGGIYPRNAPAPKASKPVGEHTAMPLQRTSCERAEFSNGFLEQYGLISAVFKQNSGENLTRVREARC